MTRKKITKSKLIALGVLLGTAGYSYAQQFPNPLHIPDTISGTTFNLEVKPSKKLFLQGDSTATFGINGDYLGPTLIIKEGDSIQMNVTNKLGETTTMHWHGMHVAPEDDGGPHTPILDDSTWSPDFVVLDEATTFWYHPHLHHHTARQVYNGAAGMIIVRDDNPAGDLLPHTYGVDEFPLIVQDKSFDASNQLIFTEMADTMMVNGTLGAHLDVPAQMVRFHFLNASNQRAYNLGFPPNINAWQIGSDGGLLENPIRLDPPGMPSNRVQITPGERVEIVVDFASTNDTSILLRSFNSELGVGISGGPSGPGGRPNNRLDSVDFEVMEFRVQSATANAITTPPPINLNTYDKPLILEVDRERTKIFTVDSTGFPFYINETIMDMSVINDTVILDDVEIWTLINNTDVAHPWHIHDIQFFILDINGNPPPPPLAGRKDVIIVQPFDTIRYITKFDDFANDSIPYMFHCHNLFHEDGGMMGQFIVVHTTELEDNTIVKSDDFMIYPNPSEGLFILEAKKGTMSNINTIGVYSVNGKLVKTIKAELTSRKLEIDLSQVPVGNCIVEIRRKDGLVESLKLSKK